MRTEPKTSWRERAACRSEDPDLFFPDSYDSEQARRAVAVCRACPVAEQCFGDAIASQDRWGIRGGYTPRQRVALRRRVLGEERKAPAVKGRPGGMAAKNALKTRCKYGHAFTPENTRYQGSKRCCITCYEDRLAARRAARAGVA